MPAARITDVLLLRALVCIGLFASIASAQRRTVTGEGSVRTSRRETLFHLLIAGDATSLSVESGRCHGGVCPIERHWLFEGPLTNGPEPLRASLSRVSTRDAGASMSDPAERSDVTLECRRSAEILRCTLTGALPPSWGHLPRSFELQPRGM